MSNILTKSLIIVLITLLLGSGVVFGEDREVLEKQIQEKNAELLHIKNEITDTRDKLEETRDQKQTLTSEISNINSRLRQVELGIRSSEVTIERLDLEIGTLQEDITGAEQTIDVKQAALGDILRRIQEKDNESILFIMVKNEKLSDSLFEIQALRDVYSDLLVKINELSQAKNHFENILDKTERNRGNKTIELSNFSNRKVIEQNLQEEKGQFLAITKNQEQSYQQYIEELRERQSQILQEIFEIESKLTSGINFANLPDKLPGLFDNPVPNSRVITQEYGITPWSRRFYASGFHNGIDIGAPSGTEVVAAHDGIVVAVGNQDQYCWGGAYGKFVVIRHYMGLTTLYAHLSLFTPKEGDTIKKGQILGYVGATGLATGPHLHFTIYESASFYMGGSRVCGPMPFGGHINPRNYTMF